ncbi:MAG: histidine phosphatase family protein [Chloroflexi bacterium]|nr:histidine phosphatase family protein [Chloroflexota bacterium]
MRLLLIRHGETDHNAERLALGREDVPLNERGQLQARALAEALAGASFGDITAVYSSPLQRATATASPLAEALELPVQVEAGLIEMEIGEMEGLTFPQVRERYPDFLRDWLSERLADVTMPGGESLRQVQERGWATVEAIRDRHPDETVAAVSHNFVILSLLCQVLGLPLARFRSLRHELAAVSVLELDASRNALVTMNDRCHLRE